MSVSAIFGTRLAIAPLSNSYGIEGRRRRTISETEVCGLAIECSSRPKKKGTAHHMKTRPRKTQPWDINRKPTVYPPLPPLPPDWTLVISADGTSVPPTPPPSPPTPTPST